MFKVVKLFFPVIQGVIHGNDYKIRRNLGMEKCPRTDETDLSVIGSWGVLKGFWAKGSTPWGCSEYYVQYRRGI
jgi:hypothetical protein